MSFTRKFHSACDYARISDRCLYTEKNIIRSSVHMPVTWHWRQMVCHIHTRYVSVYVPILCGREVPLQNPSNLIELASNVKWVRFCISTGIVKSILSRLTQMLSNGHQMETGIKCHHLMPVSTRFDYLKPIWSDLKTVLYKIHCGTNREWLFLL